MRSVTTIVTFAMLLSSGCGTTHIVTGEPRAKIFANGAMIGKGSAELRQRGIPGTTDLLVVAADGRRERRQIKREFTLTTFALGLVSAYVCWIACWEYPSTVSVLLDSRQGSAAGWDSGGDDPWMLAPQGWAPAIPDAPMTPPTPAAPPPPPLEAQDPAAPDPPP